jgi:hypothetical protein
VDVQQPPSGVQVTFEAIRAHRHSHTATLRPGVRSPTPGANAAHRKARQTHRPRGGAGQASRPTPPERDTASKTSATASTSGQQSSTPLCLRCGQTGHFRRECTGSVKIFCSRCRKDGVMSKDCPCQSGNASGLCALGEPAQSPSTPPNDRPFTEKSDHRPHVTVQILGELHAALVDTGAVGSSLGTTSATSATGASAPPLRPSSRPGWPTTKWTPSPRPIGYP